MLQYSPKIVTDSLVMCLDASNNKSYPAADLPVKGGLALWLDAADDTTFSYSSGTLVSQWRDKSGLNNHTSQATVLNQPSRSTAQNSRKIVTFDGTNDSLSTSNSLDLSVTHTIFAIASQTTGTSDAGLVSINNSLNNGLTLHNGSTYYSYYGDGSKYATSAITTSTSYIFTKVFKGTSSTTRQVYLNGTSATTTGVIANSDASGVIRLGQQSTYLNGTIAEVIIFNRELTATELKQVHTYLGQKWGISNTDRIAINLAGGFTSPWLLGVGDGATNNMPTYSPYNKTFVFDGTNDIISYPNALGTFGSYTFSFWARRNVENKMALSAYGNASFYWYGDNSWAYTHGGVVGEKYYNKAVSIPLGSYGHYCVTYDGAAVRIYRNGVFEDSQATTGAAVFNVGLQLGRYGADAVNYAFSGDIANFLMYTRALSAAEVQQNYESQKSRFANYIVTSGLVLNLDAGNPYSYAGAGTTWYDTSENAINASATGNINYSNLYNGVFSVYPSVNSYFATSTVSALNLGSSSFSIEAWVYFDASVASDDVYRGVMSLGTNSSNYVYISKWRSGLYSGLYVQYIAAAGTVTGVYQANDYNPVSRWTHVVATKSSNVLYLYVNGVLYSTASNLNTTFTGNSYVLIANAHAGVGTLNGYVGESRVYNISLSAAQVLQNYNATKGRFGL